MTATMTPVDERAAFDVVCEPCGYFRHGITQRHAFNAVNRHNADHHAEPVFTISGLAGVMLHHQEQAAANPGDAEQEARAQTYLAAWCVLTGLRGNRALKYARTVRDKGITAHVTPF